jgi:enamine deaminase RidA (YjgF/YER057c/UK114 family)
LFGQPCTRIAAGDGSGGTLHVALPVLAGGADEVLLAGTESPRSSDGFCLHSAAGQLAGFAVAPPEVDLEAAAAGLYEGLFRATHGLHLYRIWNYVPQINAEEHGLENYRRFCRGRSLAFERQFGSGFRRLLPAASAVGSVAGPLAVGFLAGGSMPRHFENPRQVPAFEYPPQYGPRPPSFARATVVTTESGRQVIISGTAAITGHATVAAGDLDRQLGCTLDNLSLIAATAGAADAFGASPAWSRRFKVYVRHAEDHPGIAARLEAGLLRAGDSVQYLLAGLCRSELLVEIEAILSTAG